MHQSQGRRVDSPDLPFSSRLSRSRARAARIRACPASRTWIKTGRESASLEYKQSAAWADLSASSHPHVPSGWRTHATAERSSSAWQKGPGGTFSYDGMSDDHLASFPAEEDLVAAVNGFAEPFISLMLERVDTPDGTFLVISVPEFV